MTFDFYFGLLSISWAKSGLWSNKISTDIELTHLFSIFISTRDQLSALSIIIGPANIKIGLYR